MNRYLLFVGCQNGDSVREGAYVFALDASYNIVAKSGLSGCLNPMFFAHHPTKNIFYSANDHPNSGSVSTFVYHPRTAGLRLVDTLPLPGEAGICHIVVAGNGQYVAISNFWSGSVMTLSLDERGNIIGPTARMKRTGHGPMRGKQDGPHPHCVQFDSTGRFLFVCDLGTDEILRYPFHKKTGSLGPECVWPVDPAQGPRHAVFHPSGRWLYVLTEIGNQIYMYEVADKTRNLVCRQMISTQPEAFSGFATAGEVMVSGNGKCLVASNRIYDSLVSYRIVKNGTLTRPRYYSNHGGEPRHISLSPDQKILVVANQDSCNIVFFAFNDRTAEIGAKVKEIPIHRPTYAKLVAIR